MSKLLRFAVAVLIISAAVPAAAAETDWSKVAQALGKEGSFQPGGVYRVGLPRSDLHVTLDGVAIKPGLALGGWLAFEPMGNSAMVMGDLVLTQDEIAPVMKKFEEGGVEITALHNHLLRAEPMTLYMHVLGNGDPVKLAQTLHAGLALSKTPLQTAAQPAAAPPAIDFDTGAVDKAMGYKGKNTGGIYQFTISRAKPVTEGGMEIPGAMGSAIGINFQPTGSGKAAITGDFVLSANEVNPVIKALAASGIKVTALHSHMLTEQPRLFFMHFWANDDASKLARGLRGALDRIDVKKSG
ncbi:MAG TPA: DUF1259 domain-containing protein [Stellaceae bacterium]|jgi:hypothetical protein|nr:DUF1259 domain-containing protein [Stellaceae bacterium]